MSAASLWWIVAGAAVATELLTGTFYLLMVALGLAAGALAAHLNWPLTAQFVTAALVGGLAVGLLHLRRRQAPPPPAAGANRDVNLDVGESVHVAAWGNGGLTTVRYRGADWQAQLAPGSAVGAGMHHIIEVVGNRLVLQPQGPAA